MNPPTEEDITILTKQIPVTSEQARELLTKHHNDHVAAITAFFDVKAPSMDRVDIGTNSGHRLEVPLPEESAQPEPTTHVPILDIMNKTEHKANQANKTYVVIGLSENSANFTKKKSYGTLIEVLARYRPHIGLEEGTDAPVNLLPIHGKLLSQWCIVNGGIALTDGQIVTNTWIVEHDAFKKINKSATLFARTSGLINESESIIGSTLLINNVEFD